MDGPGAGKNGWACNGSCRIGDTERASYCECGTSRIPDSGSEPIGSIQPGMELEEGRYHIEVSHSGYHTDEKWVTLKAGEENAFSFTLKPKTPTGFTNNLGMKFVYIKPGSFMMGSPSDEPGRDNDETQHRVTLTQGFYMQTTEVTQGQWKAVMGNNPSQFKNCGDDCPVETVSWNDCQKFIQKLNGMQNKHRYRLPTEAEWEYACRAGSTGPYAGDLNAMGWYRKNSEFRTHGVAKKRPNAWGLYDMHGNVWEWAQDWKGDYPSGPVTDPEGPSGGARRVGRGGGWSDNAGSCRSASRDGSRPGRQGQLPGLSPGLWGRLGFGFLPFYLLQVSKKVSGRSGCKTQRCKKIRKFIYRSIWVVPEVGFKGSGRRPRTPGGAGGLAPRSGPKALAGKTV